MQLRFCLERTLLTLVLVFFFFGPLAKCYKIQPQFWTVTGYEPPSLIFVCCLASKRILKFSRQMQKKINSNNNIILRIWLWRAVWMIKPQSDCTGLHRANIAWISSTNSFSLQLMFQLEITLSCFTFLLFFLWAFDNMLQNPVSSLGSERNKSLQAKGISRSQAWLFFCCCSLASQSIFDQIKE